MNPVLRGSSAHVFVEDMSAPVLDEEDLHHLGRVLRLRKGEPVTCTDGRWSWRECRWTGDGIEPVGGIRREDAPLHPITVAVCPLKGDRTDMVVEKLVEVGVDRILVVAPVERTVVRWTGDRAANALERYRRVARAAAMQSRRVHLPEIAGPVSLADLTGEGTGFAEPGGTVGPEQVATLVVGPEGGFSPAEIVAAPVLVDLGDTVLRAETAAIVGATRMVAHRAASMRHTG